MSNKCDATAKACVRQSENYELRFLLDVTIYNPPYKSAEASTKTGGVEGNEDREGWVAARLSCDGVPLGGALKSEQ